MFNRLIKTPKSYSFFLFGARGTGKSTLIRERIQVHESLVFDLLDLNQEARLQANPMALSEQLDQFSESYIKPSQGPHWVVIDEVQKIPELLDIVHSQIEKGKFVFALTGSSARKLKRGTANLLAGRAFT